MKGIESKRVAASTVRTADDAREIATRVEMYRALAERAEPLAVVR